MKWHFKPMALVCVALTLVFAKNLHAVEAPQKPNLIILLADDLGWGSVSCYGGKGLKTPNIDRLASQGRLFRHAYAPGSVCSPTRYALMTGRYYWRTSVKDGKVLPANHPLHIETNRVTLASLAKAQGYRTAAIGKWHLGLGTAAKVDWNAPLQPGPRALGFDYFFGMPANVGGPPHAYIENEQLINRVPGKEVTWEGVGKDAKTLGIEPLRKDDEVMHQLTDKAVAWLEKNHDARFFLYFAPNAIHEPVTPAAEFTGSPFGKLGDFIQELDRSVGRILETLDKHKLADKTIVLFTSDNGGVAREQNPNASAAIKAGLVVNGPLRGGKHDIWEGGFREPYLVRWPGKIPAGTTCDDIVCLSDTLATLAGILKTKISPGNAEDSFDVSGSWLGSAAASGKDKPLTRPSATLSPSDGERDGVRGARDFVVMQDAFANYAIRQGPWKFIERENPPPLKARNEQVEQKIARVRKQSPVKDELFNLVDDPGETKNTATQHPDIVERLRRLLAKTRDQGFSRP